MNTLQQRVPSIDLLRGIVMVLMVLDHARYFMHDFNGNPEDLSKTYPVLFFTRWITHFCAPVFIFLAGVSAFLYYQKNGLRKTSIYLLTRGTLLILLELTLFRFAWDGNLISPTISLLVIWAIGISMIFLGLIIRIKNWQVLLAFGLLVICVHNLLDNVTFDNSTTAGKLWMLLHVPGPFRLTDSLEVFVLYPVLPYFGIVTVGWCLGKYFTPSYSDSRSKILLLSGLVASLGFIILRSTNVYGDPSPWTIQEGNISTFLSFIKTTKYPTSLQYILMTLGPSLLFLLLTDKMRPGPVSNIFITLGKVPMFFYILHLFVIKLVILLLMKDYHQYALWQVYIGWVLSCTLLYLLCRWYATYKSAHKGAVWASYI